MFGISSDLQHLIYEAIWGLHQVINSASTLPSKIDKRNMLNLLNAVGTTYFIQKFVKSDIFLNIFSYLHKINQKCTKNLVCPKTWSWSKRCLLGKSQYLLEWIQQNISHIQQNKNFAFQDTLLFIWYPKVLTDMSKTNILFVYFFF